MVLMLVFGILFDIYRDSDPFHFNFDMYFFLAAYIPLTLHLIRVHKNQDPKLLDPELKKLALSTFALSVLLALCMIYFLSDLVVNNS